MKNRCGQILLCLRHQNRKFRQCLFGRHDPQLNPVMATAAETVIVEAEEISDEPLNPNEVTIPGIFVDYIAS